MNMRLTIDGAGRVALPKPLRQKPDLAPGDTLELNSTGENITLRPVRNVTPLTKEKGVWVFRTGQPLPAQATEDVRNQVRDQRDRQNLAQAE